MAMSKMWQKVLEPFAQQNGLKMDVESNLLYGRSRGHNMIIRVLTDVNNLELTVTVQGNDGRTPTDQELGDLCKANKCLQSYQLSGRRITFVTQARNTLNKRVETLQEAMEVVSSYLATQSYYDVCAECGTESGYEAYVINGHGHMLCPNCFAKVENGLANNQQALKAKKGNLLTGLVGALLGSLLGVVAIVVVGQMGYVAAISGLIMGVCTIKGFEMLGGKINVLSAILCCVIVAVMTYVGFQCDWALFLMKELRGSPDFFEAMQSIGVLLDNGRIESSGYYVGLGQLYIFVALGAVPTLWSAVKQSGGNYSTKKLG